ncbi:MAG: metallo-mystery pair system four-Cys motif protein [Paucibacter sp.]|nr:metallo-mystery pair system four-Cys motif protein [Roseateles sp.]
MRLLTDKTKCPRPPAALLAALLSALLGACGGGGGDKVSTPELTEPVPTPLPVPQAFAAAISGTVAVGAPVIGASVNAKCLNGSAAALASSDVLGAYSIELNGLKPPCLLQARGGTALGTPVSIALHGLVQSTGSAPINPLTDLQLARAYAVDPAMVFARFAGQADLPNAQKLNEAGQFLAQQLSALGLKAPSQDLLSEAFALGGGTDQLLDQLSAKLSAQQATLSQLRESAQGGGSFAGTLNVAKAEADERVRLQAKAAAETQAAEEARAAAAVAAAKAAEQARAAVIAAEASAKAEAEAAAAAAKKAAEEAAAKAAEEARAAAAAKEASDATRAAAEAAAAKAKAEAEASAAAAAAAAIAAEDARLAAAAAAAKAAADKANAEAEAAAAEAARLAEIARLAALEAAATVTGMAADGAPVSGANVLVRCTAGSTPSNTVTDSNGGFAVKLLGASAPCLLQVRGGQVGGQANTQVLHGWVDRLGGTVQLSPLSELTLAHAFADSPANVFARFAGSTDVPSSASLDAGKTWLRSQLAALSLPSPAADPLSGPIRAGDSDGQLMLGFNQLLYDRVSSLAAAIQTAVARANLATMLNADRAISIQFAAVAGSTPVSCGPTLPPLGSTQTPAKLLDFRFYLSEAALIRADGTLVSIKLVANNAWHYTAPSGAAVSLIDLEDGSANCAESPEQTTAATNAFLSGTVPAGRYVGLRATLGVPESLNHSQTSAVPAPLDSAAMGWSWQAGRKFAKIEVTQPSAGAWTSDSFFVHLGSTGCTGNAGLGTVVCAKPNRATLQFPAFDPSAQKIAVDLTALLAGTNITINQGGAQGCMSAGTDRDCLKVFEALAIDWKSDGSGSGLPINEGRGQTVFKVMNK